MKSSQYFQFASIFKYVRARKLPKDDGMGSAVVDGPSICTKSLKMKTNNGEVSYLSRDRLKRTVLQKIISYEYTFDLV
jgi:hypothetical protein